MKFFQTYTHIVIYLILIHETNLVSSGDPEPRDQGEHERLRPQQPSASASAYGTYNNTILVEVDINSDRTTDDYYYVKNRETVIFTPKANRVIGSVREGNCNQCQCSNRQIWMARDQTEFALKVVIKLKRNLVPTIPCNIFMTIFLCNGKRRYFRKCNHFVARYRNEWVEKVYNLQETEHPPHIQIITADDLNGTDARVNDRSQYVVNKNFIESFILEYVFDIHKFANCIEVRYADERVWRYDPKYLPLDKVYFIPSERTLIFSYNDVNYYAYKF